MLYYLKQKKTERIRIIYSFLISIMEACNPSFLLYVFLFVCSRSDLVIFFSFKHSVNQL